MKYCLVAILAFALVVNVVNGQDEEKEDKPDKKKGGHRGPHGPHGPHGGGHMMKIIAICGDADKEKCFADDPNFAKVKETISKIEIDPEVKKQMCPTKELGKKMHETNKKIHEALKEVMKKDEVKKDEPADREAAKEKMMKLRKCLHPKPE